MPVYAKSFFLDQGGMKYCQGTYICGYFLRDCNICRFSNHSPVVVAFSLLVVSP